VAAGAAAAARRLNQRRRVTRSPVGFDYVTPWSTTTPGWPTPRSCRREGPDLRGFLTRAAAYFAAHGITRIERIMTDNAWAYRWSLREVTPQLGARQKFIRPHCPWQNGKVERPEPDPAHRMGLPPALHQQPQRPPPLRPGSSTTTLNAATAHSEDTPSQPPATNLMARYN
jgi:transposase InsO family protein